MQDTRVKRHVHTGTGTTCALHRRILQLPSLVTTLAITLLCTAAAQAQSTSIAVGPRPESITQGWGGRYYVSIQGPSGAAGVNDGEIRQVEPDSGVVTPFVDGLENPRGLAFTGTYLVCADGPRIWIIDASGNVDLLAEAAQFPFPAAFFNDVAPAHNERAVYVSEMGNLALMRDAAGVMQPAEVGLSIPAASRIYRISIPNGQISEAMAPTRQALIINGVKEARHGKGQRLLVLDMFYGSIVRHEMHTDQSHILATGFRGLDSLEEGADGTLYVSSFDGGAVYKLDADGTNPVTLISGVGYKTTADMALDEENGRMLVPDTAHGTVIILPTAGGTPLP
jgi:hypothetical protein